MRKSLRRQVITRDAELAETHHVPFACPHCAFEFIFGPEDPNIEVDHKIPRNAGGTDDLDNLIVACRSCNRSKIDAALPVKNRKHVKRVVLCSCDTRMFISDFAYHVNIDLVQTNALLCVGCGGDVHDEEPPDPDLDSNFSKVTRKSFA